MPQYSSDPTAFIILNPHAAKGRAAAAESAIAACFTNERFPFSVARTERPMHAAELAAKAVSDGYKLIVAAGGDGTLNEVIDGVMRETTRRSLAFDDVPVVGLIPVGRGNDFAYIAKTPRSVQQACAAVMEQAWIPTDCAVVKGGKYPEGRYFVNGVGLGFEPTVNFVASDFKHLSGMPSYLAAFVKVLVNYPGPVKVTMHSDQGDVEVSTQQISVCNGRRMGSTFIMAPDAIIDDGLLDVCYANREIQGHEILWFALKFFKGDQVKSPRLTTIRTRTISIVGDADLPVHADGEEISRSCRSVDIELLPAALKFIRKP
jgi:YegS/Rv2252/BmrU family lipid kinase